MQFILLYTSRVLNDELNTRCESYIELVGQRIARRLASNII